MLDIGVSCAFNRKILGQAYLRGRKILKTMKYKVLAADDEFWSRENIRNLIPWEEYSLEFLEPACDGEEVMERIEEEKPDIILTDINMPFLSGLELLERLQKEYPEIITVAISGYDDFDKVKGVFVSGGLDYLLKPVGKEEMVKVLTKALNLLEERENTKSRMKPAGSVNINFPLFWKTANIQHCFPENYMDKLMHRLMYPVLILSLKLPR